MKKAYVWMSVWTASATLVASAAAGEIAGKVTLGGTPPPEIEIKFDPACGKLHADKVSTRHYVVGKENGLGDVVVYLKEGAPKGPVPADMPVLDQKGCVYEPFVWAVMTGQKFKVRNSDAVLHNVHATPKVNKEFNFAQPMKGQENVQSFDKPEMFVRIKCDVHPWMFSYACVVDHPYFAVTDKDGNFKIANVPPGEYTIEATHRKATAETAKVKVGADGKATANFTLKTPQL